MNYDSDRNNRTHKKPRSFAGTIRSRCAIEAHEEAKPSETLVHRRVKRAPLVPTGDNQAPKHESEPPASSSNRTFVMAIKHGHQDISLQEDKVTWFLNSGAQVNVTGDPTLFVEISKTKTNRLEFGDGIAETMGIGTTQIEIKNHATGKQEERLLEEVRFVPSSSSTLMSLRYIQLKCNFKLRNC